MLSRANFSGIISCKFCSLSGTKIPFSLEAYGMEKCLDNAMVTWSSFAKPKRNTASATERLFCFA